MRLLWLGGREWGGVGAAQRLLGSPANYSGNYADSRRILLAVFPLSKRQASAPLAARQVPRTVSPHWSIRAAASTQRALRCSCTHSARGAHPQPGSAGRADLQPYCTRGALPAEQTNMSSPAQTTERRGMWTDRMEPNSTHISRFTLRARARGLVQRQRGYASQPEAIPLLRLHQPVRDVLLHRHLQRAPHRRRRSLAAHAHDDVAPRGIGGVRERAVPDRLRCQHSNVPSEKISSAQAATCHQTRSNVPCAFQTRTWSIMKMTPAGSASGTLFVIEAIGMPSPSGGRSEWTKPPPVNLRVLPRGASIIRSSSHRRSG
eukprot:COSAG06_NODE_1120_length_10630_cov_130.014244_9_plen_318_part_00